MMHWDGYGWGMGGGWVFMFFWILVIVATVLLIRWIISSNGRKGQGTLSRDTALDILKKRYARGEISREEYEQMKKDIS